MKDIELWHGDCLNLLHQINNATVSLIFADLPYSFMLGRRLRKCTQNAWDRPLNMDVIWEQFLRVGKPDCYFIFTGTQPFASFVICSQPKLFRYDLIWEKSKTCGFLNANRQPLRRHEHIIVFNRRQGFYAPQKSHNHVARPIGHHRPASVHNYGDHDTVYKTVGTERHPSSVLHAMDADLQTSVRNKRLHPTQKPVALIKWLLQSYTRTGELIMDPASGSMTTAVAAHQTGRRAICIERDAEYYRRGVERVQKAMAEPRQDVLL